MSLPLGAELEHDSRHLPLLYDTGKLLARFESIERTLPAVLARLTDALSFTSAVLVECDPSRIRTFVWHVSGVPRTELERETKHAKRTLEYLAGLDAARLESGDETATELSFAAPLDREAGRVELENPNRRVTLPLAVDRREVFGILRAKARRALDDVDLAFLNAVANQIAVAVAWHTRPRAGPQWVQLALDRLRRLHGLTAAEAETAAHAVRGLSNKEIARLRGSSPHTIRAQLLSVYRKLGIDSRSVLAFAVCCESHRAAP